MVKLERDNAVIIQKSIDRVKNALQLECEDLGLECTVYQHSAYSSSSSHPTQQASPA